MKKILLYSMMAILLLSLAHADCYDSDDGPKNLDTPARYLGIDGFVTEGNNTYYDVCVTRNNGVEINSSNWVREYYCDNNQMESRDYFCPTYYYTECLTVHKAAACDDYRGPSDYNETSANTTSTTNTTNTTTTTTQTNTASNTTTSINCGDKKVELGEKCDPPGKNCYTDAFQEGICDFSCSCDSSMTRDMFNRLNQTLTEEKEEETNDSSIITFTVNDTKDDTTKIISKNSTPQITGALVLDPIDDLIKKAKEPPKDFSDSFGIKITSAVTTAVMSIWNLIMNLIGG
jgi:hypothetical protein